MPARDRRAQRRDLVGDALRGDLLRRQHHGARRVAAARRGEQAERAQDAAGARAEDALDPELRRQLGGVHRPRAAERQQREPPRVDPALDRHHAERPGHLLVREPDDALGRLELAQPELGGQARRPPRPRRRASSATPPARLESGASRPRSEVRVGHRRLGPAAPVAGGPGVGAGRARPGAQRAAVVAPPDRAAAGADGVDVHHRQLDHPPADRPRLGLPDPPALDDARRRTTCRPCPARSRRRRPRSSPGAPRPTAPPAGPERTLHAPCRAASRHGATPPDERMISGSGSAPVAGGWPRARPR